MGIKGLSQSERPFWDRKNQKAYRIYRTIIWIIIFGSLAATAFIWFKMDNFLR
jgi:hypothetical protein